MASGKVHARASVFFLILSLTLLLFAYSASEVTGLEFFFVMLGLTLGLFITPDLDIPTGIYTKRFFYKISFLAGRIYSTFWASYGALFSHRGISHVLILGTATRAIWLFRHLIMILLFLAVFDGTFFVVDWQKIDFNLNIYYVSITFISWCLMDSVHLILDGKRKKKRGRQRHTIRPPNKSY